MPHLPRIDKVFQSSTIALTLSDASAEDRALVKVNDAFCEMTGYAPGECIGRDCRFLQRDDRQQPALAELRDALARQRDTEVVLRNYTKAGQGFDNLLFIHHIHDVDGTVLHVLGSQFAIRPPLTAAGLDRHLDRLETGIDGLSEAQGAVRRTIRRQLSNSVSLMLHSAVMRERMKRWVER